MKKFFFLSGLFLMICCNSGTSQNTLIFKKQDYIGKWPFSVDKIEVYCNGYKEIYCRASNGKTYALNGTAKGVSVNNPAISKVEEIWLDDPEHPGLKLYYTDFITEGLTLCENK
ncbi:DUF2511 domain-containing protein [Chryseobacterium sp. G0240]|uniref:DUF2511 domain-containing protein n=1 Tax=Chryseobacterium sp. G0240 TaxID=2487066 RepID=UPI000F45D998|nr:DUF2511 domain-containing protein [Chryseobacterium sp. G0240]ROI04806.1 DUF2511 domain-containing protein [Chryseobacterium sp. G0240]